MSTYGPRLHIAAAGGITVLHRSQCRTCYGSRVLNVAECGHNGECPCDLVETECEDCRGDGFTDRDCSCSECESVRESVEEHRTRLSRAGFAVEA